MIEVIFLLVSIKQKGLSKNVKKHENESCYSHKRTFIFSNTIEKGNKNNWDLNKILTELAVPKDQKQLILDSGKLRFENISCFLRILVLTAGRM